MSQFPTEVEADPVLAELSAFLKRQFEGAQNGVAAVPVAELQVRLESLSLHLLRERETHEELRNHERTLLARQGELEEARKTAAIDLAAAKKAFRKLENEAKIDRDEFKRDLDAVKAEQKRTQGELNKTRGRVGALELSLQNRDKTIADGEVRRQRLQTRLTASENERKKAVSQLETQSAQRIEGLRAGIKRELAMIALALLAAVSLGWACTIKFGWENVARILEVAGGVGTIGALIYAAYRRWISSD